MFKYMGYLHTHTRTAKDTYMFVCVHFLTQLSHTSFVPNRLPTLCLPPAAPPHPVLKHSINMGSYPNEHPNFTHSEALISEVNGTL